MHRRVMVIAVLGLLVPAAGCSSGSGSSGSGSSGSATSPTSTSSAPSSPTSTSSSPTATSTTSRTSTAASSAPADQTAILSALPGSSSGACVEATKRTMRSGGFGVGDLSVAKRDYKEYKGSGTPTLLLRLMPAHPGAMRGAHVVATRTRKPVIVQEYDVTRTSTVGSARFYDWSFPVADSGVWRLEVSSGSDKGCFEIALNRPH